MAEASTTETNGAKTIEPRRLHPGLAFFGGLFGVGLGYAYVGRIRYALLFAVAPFLLMVAMGWTRLLVDPFAWYLFNSGLAVILLVQLVHPIVLAWSQPLAPAKPYNRGLWYGAWFLGVAVLYEVFVSARGITLGYEIYRIPSNSMSPTVQTGDKIVVDTWRYRGAKPVFGDVVICEIAELTAVKRVVGVPGDTIELRGPTLVRNGSIVAEPYVNSEQGARLRDAGPLSLGADQYFVLGDNRGNSNDSRYVGPIMADRISGRVQFVAYGESADRFRVVLASD